MAGTLAEAIAEELVGRGVRRIFGIPGGGSNLELIEAVGRRGIEFVLTRTETAAAIMAAVTGELTGVPGVALTGVGPGAASAVNGVAYAALERAPMILFTDGPAASQHQAFDQNTLFRPVSKAQARLRPDDGRGRLAELIDDACRLPRGPVHVDLTESDARAVATDSRPEPVASVPALIDGDALESARALISASRRPVIIAGMEARYADADATLGRLADALGCPVLLTYKAKGCLADADPHMVGLFTGASAEAACLGRADLIVLYGFDPVEKFPSPWYYTAQVLDLFPGPKAPNPMVTAATLTAPLSDAVEILLSAATPSDWTGEDIAELRRDLRDRLALAGDGHTVATVVDALAARAPDGCRLTVDAGAHMFSAMGLWQATAPHDVLKSNGLSTMGFAVPAAIAAALETPERPVVALTGDGGLMMCLGELATAAEHDLKVVTIVLNDGALSLIDIKQQSRQHPVGGVRYPTIDFAVAGLAMGCAAWRGGRGEPLADVITEAFEAAGPALIDVDVDPVGYGDQLSALRG